MSVTIVSHAKMAEPIEVPFGCEFEWAQGTIIRWGSSTSMEWAIFRGIAAISKI